MIDPELRLHMDEGAIRRLLARYNICGDRGDVAGLAAIFAEDGVLEFGGIASAPGPQGVAERLAVRRERDPHFTVMRHHLTTSLIEIEGDGATGRSYFAVMTDIGPDHHGVYVDRFRRAAAGWRLVHRLVRIDWQAPDSLFAPMTVRGR